MSAEEKKKLGTGLSQLSPEDLDKALDIIAQKNPNFEATAAEVDIDMDAQVLTHQTHPCNLMAVRENPFVFLSVVINSVLFCS